MIIPFFISNGGCPHRCSFCNQEISGGDDPQELTADYFHGKVRSFLAVAAVGKKPGRDAEIAFYGGNFTGLAPAEQERLLGMAHRYVEAGTVTQIRISPSRRPGPGVERLAHFASGPWRSAPVPSIEVWRRPGRRHRRDRKGAVNRLKERVAVILHLMAGLPGDDAGKFRKPSPEQRRLSRGRCVFIPRWFLREPLWQQPISRDTIPRLPFRRRWRSAGRPVTSWSGKESGLFVLVFRTRR